MAKAPARYKTGFTKLRSALSLMAQAATPEVVVTITNLSADKLRWLRLGGRDFEVATGELLREMGTAYVKGLNDLARGRTRDARRPWQLAGEVFKDRVASRLATSGGDVRSRMTPLAPSTIARKGHARIGVDSGKLLTDVATAAVVVTLTER
jgi:hypothetical protein